MKSIVDLLSMTRRAIVSLLTSTPKGRADRAACKVLQSINRGDELDDRLRARYRLALDAAKTKLGERWVHHPNYVPTPRHSNHHDIWWPNRVLRFPEVRYARETMSPAARAALAGFPAPAPIPSASVRQLVVA